MLECTDSLGRARRLAALPDADEPLPVVADGVVVQRVVAVDAQRAEHRPVGGPVDLAPSMYMAPLSNSA